MESAVIVESLGTSGAGKSTAIPYLIRMLRDEGMLAMSAIEAIDFSMRDTWAGRMVRSYLPSQLQNTMLWLIFSWIYAPWHTLEFVVQHPRLTGYVAKSQLRRKIRWAHRILILGLFMQMTGRFQFIKRHTQPDQLIFLDEGFVHRATHLFVSETEAVDPEQVLAYLKLLPPVDLVLWLRAPVELCMARVYTRGLQIRLAHLSKSEVLKFITNAERVCQIAAEEIKNAGRAVVEVENIEGVEACAVKLYQAVMDHYKDQRHRLSF